LYICICICIYIYTCIMSYNTQMDSCIAAFPGVNRATTSGCKMYMYTHTCRTSTQVDSCIAAFPGVKRATTLHALVKDADVVMLGQILCIDYLLSYTHKYICTHNHTHTLIYVMCYDTALVREWRWRLWKTRTTLCYVCFTYVVRDTSPVIVKRDILFMYVAFTSCMSHDVMQIRIRTALRCTAVVICDVKFSWCRSHSLHLCYMTRHVYE